MTGPLDGPIATAWGRATTRARTCLLPVLQWVPAEKFDDLVGDVARCIMDAEIGARREAASDAACSRRSRQ